MKYHLNVNSPQVWGPMYWNMFFERAATYPNSNPTPQQRKLYRDYYMGFLDNLPCALCNSSFNRFWRELPIENFLDSKKDLIMWVYLLKTKVNRKLSEQGVLKRNPTFASVLNKYK